MKGFWGGGRVVLFSLLVMLPAHVRAAGISGTIDFESDPVQFPPDDTYVPQFVSDDSPYVTFTSTVFDGAVQVRRGAPELMGRTGILPTGSASVFTPSGLKISFSRPATALSILFGNDDPNPAYTEDRALLEVFSGNTPVGQAVVLFNKNDLADQTISIATSGTQTFDMATLTYVNSSLQPQSPLAEFVDEITFTIVPEPSTAEIFLSTLLAWMPVRRVKRHW